MDDGKLQLLDLLPGIFREDPFVGAFLAPFAEILEELRRALAEVDRTVVPLNRDDPAWQADADFLPWLAAWVDLAIDAEWDEATTRRTIAEAVELYRWRGTVRGLTRFLEIYTGRRPEIRECAWPAGLQIGVASMIGGIDPATVFAEYTAERLAVVRYDYYLVQDLMPPGTLHLYRADRVRRVEVDPTSRTVTLHHVPPDSASVVTAVHGPATVSRRDGVPETRYRLSGVPAGGGPPVIAEFAGDTVLVGEEELPYRFIVDLRVPARELMTVNVDKVRAIVDLEKPAHTLYYLRLRPVAEEPLLETLQIEVHSTVGLDSTVG